MTNFNTPPNTFLKIGSPRFMAFQLGEEWSFSGPLDLALEREQYFLSNTLVHKASCSWYILQFNLESNTIFFVLAACIPKPPSSLDFIILLHPTMCILLFSLVEPHKISRLILSNYHKHGMVEPPLASHSWEWRTSQI